MFKFLIRLFKRPSILELMEDDLYETKVKALEAAKNAESWVNAHKTLLDRVQRLENTIKDEQQGAVPAVFRKYQAMQD